MDHDIPNGQSIWRVWRALLDESNNLALSHLRASETQQRMCRDLKPLKLQRIAVGKRVFEQLRTLQGDLAACVQEMVKSHKVYAEEEKQAQETRLKAMATEEKIRRRSTDIFHSMAQLHRNYEKLIIRRQAYDARSATARNEYLFQLAAINAHLKHYFTKDVPSLVKTLDGELFEKLSEVLSTLSQHEAEMCALTRERFQRVFRDASQITRSYAWESFLRACPLFDKAVQYQFEPMEGDEITLLRSPDAKEASLEQIARKLARRLVLRERRIASYENELKTLQTGCANPHNNSQAVPGGPDSENQEELLSFNQEYVEHKVEEIQFAIRREEIERVKIEACLGLLRNSAVEVKQFVAEARAAADAAVSAALAQQLRETDGGLISDLRVTSHLSDRPTGEGSSDSVSSSIDNQRIFSRHYTTPRGSRSNTLGAGYIARGHTRTESSYSIRANTLGSDKWTSAAPRPATIGQASNRKPGNGTVTPNRTTAWGSLRAINSASHDYQNVEPTPRAQDDLSMDKTRTQHGSLGRREHKSNDALVNESLDLEVLWSDHGRLQQASVLHEFRAKRPDELDLVMHETVVLLDPAGSSGWVKVRSLIDGNEGLVPLNYLRLHQPQLRSRSQLETDNEDEVEASQLDDKEVPNTSTAAVIPPKIVNASPYENIVAPPPRVEEEVIKHSKSHLPSYGTKGNSGLHQNSIPTASGDQLKSINVGHPTIPTTSATPDIKKPGKHLPIPGSFVRTLIEFEGNHPDELHFFPGSVIRVLGRAPVPDCATDKSNSDEQSPLNRLNNSITSGVDDGWWEGELLVPSSNSLTTQQYTRIRGVFPSMLIHPMSSEDAEPWKLVWKNSVPNQPELNGNECDANSDRKTVSSGLQTERTDQDDTIRCTLKTTPVSNTDGPDAPHSDGEYIQLKSEQLTNSRPVEHGHSPQVLTRAMLQQAAHDEPEDELPIAEV
ncbi:hypothetical protein CRM22_003566 [Opisthorchis felineus]|uniref:SH3 domain-containing protein n=1 Tax=Opisthorchis felineus TaxID=147828 RepID=A0A4S2M0L2_OPIFE|nr:hypothetical protein CRM22_003566 [Opisthorchis felineus]